MVERQVVVSTWCFGACRQLHLPSAGALLTLTVHCWAGYYGLDLCSPQNDDVAGKAAVCTQVSHV